MSEETERAGLPIVHFADAAALEAWLERQPAEHKEQQMSQAVPFLMFQDGNAEEAMSFYVAQFADGAVEEIDRYGPDGPGTEGSVQRALFRVAGQQVMCIDSPMKHAFGFTPSFSFFVECDSVEELDRLAAALGEGGEVMMPLDDYGFSKRFTWLSDRYGVSWQLNLAP